MAGVAICLIHAVAGCDIGPADLASATDEERRDAVDNALAVLDRVVDAAMQRDFDALCSAATSQGNCRRQLQGHEAAVPTTPPQVECTRIVPASDSRRSGVTVVVAGHDGEDQPYRSEFFVIETDDGWRTQTAVFWAGIGLVEEGRNTAREGGDIDVCES